MSEISASKATEENNIEMDGELNEYSDFECHEHNLSHLQNLFFLFSFSLEKEPQDFLWKCFCTRICEHYIYTSYIFKMKIIKITREMFDLTESI